MSFSVRSPSREVPKFFACASAVCASKRSWRFTVPGPVQGSRASPELRRASLRRAARLDPVPGDRGGGESRKGESLGERLTGVLEVARPLVAGKEGAGGNPLADPLVAGPALRAPVDCRLSKGGLIRLLARWSRLMGDHEIACRPVGRRGVGSVDHHPVLARKVAGLCGRGSTAKRWRRRDFRLKDEIDRQQVDLVPMRHRAQEIGNRLRITVGRAGRPRRRSGKR